MYTTQPLVLGEKGNEKPKPNNARRRPLIIGLSLLAVSLVIIGIVLFVRSGITVDPSSQPAGSNLPNITPPKETSTYPEFFDSLPAPLQVAATALYERKPMALTIAAVIVALLIASIIITVVIVTINAQAVPLTPEQDISDTEDLEESWFFLGSWQSIVLGVVVIAVIIGVPIGLWILSKSRTLFYFGDGTVVPSTIYQTNVKFLPDNFDNRVVENLADDSEFLIKINEARASIGLEGLDFGPKGTLYLISEDITQFPADAICNAANQWGSHGSAISGQIHEALGYEDKDFKSNILLKATKELGTTEFLIYYPPGTARAIEVKPRDEDKVFYMEGVQKLNKFIRVILMATGPMEKQRPREKYIREVYWYILQRCEALKVRHVVIPAISTGKFKNEGDYLKTPLWVLDTIREWLSKNTESNLKIVLSVYQNKFLLSLYMEYLKRHFRNRIPALNEMEQIDPTPEMLATRDEPKKDPKTLGEKKSSIWKTCTSCITGKA